MHSYSNSDLNMQVCASTVILDYLVCVDGLSTLPAMLFRSAQFHAAESTKNRDYDYKNKQYDLFIHSYTWPMAADANSYVSIFTGIADKTLQWRLEHAVVVGFVPQLQTSVTLRVGLQISLWSSVSCTRSPLPRNLGHAINIIIVT